MSDIAARPPATRRSYKGRPTVAFMAKHDFSETAQAISEFTRTVMVSRAMEAASACAAKPGNAKAIIEALGSGSEKTLQQKYGWYWEPLYHDLTFFEEMRDSVATIAGAYEAYADFIVSGLSVKCSDPKASTKINDLLFNARVNFREVVRRSAFEIASIGNSYCIPRYKKSVKDGFQIKVFKPVRASAMRVLRDEDLAVEGYVQLLHRPSEFLGPNPAAPSPTFWTNDEVCHGYTFTKHWYAYGASPFVTLPFVVKLKLTMERDIAEILHKHVPRLKVVYTPEQQMTQEKVDANIDDLKSQLAQMSASQDMVSTPDVDAEYIGPNGKMVDATGTQNHVEDQLWRVLPLGPGLLGAALSLNPEQAQQLWRMQVIRASNIRSALDTMFEPVFTRIQQEFKLDERPSLDFDSLDEQTQKTQAETHELQISNANTMRDAGIISPDDAAKHATQHTANPQQKAHSQEPTDYYSNQPNDAGDSGSSGNSKVKNKDKGPSGKKTPKTDPRPKGKRHALTQVFEGIVNDALDRIAEIGIAGLAEAVFECPDSNEPESLHSDS